jgi:hypothetical protein
MVGGWVNDQSLVYLPLRSGWLLTYLQDSFFATGSFTKAKLVYLGCYVPYLPTDYQPTSPFLCTTQELELESKSRFF